MKQLSVIVFFCLTFTAVYAQHSHAKKGKHGGYMVEVKGVANLEVIHDEKASKLTIMVFSEDGKAMAIENEPRMNVNTFNGRKQVKLVAIEPDKDGKASKFSAENELFKSGLKAKIQIKLKGKYHTLSMPHKPH